MSDYEKWRRYKRQAEAFAKLLNIEVQGDFGRAGGDVDCEVCGLKYFDHPEIDEKCPTLVLLCRGDVVKL